MKVNILSVSDLHADPSWCEWLVSEVKNEDYRAVLLPGDLIDGMPNTWNRELKTVLDMLMQLSELGIPVILCSGNHDQGLVDMKCGVEDNGLMEHLLLNRGKMPTVIMDEEVLEIAGIRIRSIPYLGVARWPEKADGDHVWLHHEPPYGTPISEEAEGCYIGDHGLTNRAIYQPGLLPPLVICGHVHAAREWWAQEGACLFLNSGQNLKAKVPHHFKLELEDMKLRIIHHPSGRSLIRRLDLPG
jgi:Icc-related predicted phosphoesterase